MSNQMCLCFSIMSTGVALYKMYMILRMHNIINMYVYYYTANCLTASFTRAIASGQFNDYNA